jgi:hypothetical protein
MSTTTPSTSPIATTPEPTPSQTPAPTAAPVVKTSPIQPQFVTLTAPVTLQIPYGQTTLQRGAKLPVVSRDAQSVVVQYMGEKYPIPIKCTDLE